jgi:hypothetical protein
MIDAELREKLPKITAIHTIETYLQDLRDAEESVRDALREQDRRYFQRINPNLGMGPGYQPRMRGYGASPYSSFTGVTGRIDTGRAVRNREYQLDETRLDKEQIVNLSITYCKTIVN